MSLPALKPLTVDQFFAWRSGDDRRYELVEGEIVAMAPTTPAHQVLAANLARRLGEALDAKPPCTVRVEASIVAPTRVDTCHHADLAVTCEPHDPEQRATPEPVVIVEILSPSTEAYDRRVKMLDYRAIASVREIVLIDPREIYCEVHRRLDGGRWLTDLLRGAEASLRLESIGFEQKLAVLYANLITV